MDDARLRSELATLHPESFGWALACCRRDRALAEDVLQRTYLKVLEGRAKYHGTGPLKTWLFAVVRRTAQDERRRAWLSRLRLVRYAGGAAGTRVDKSTELVGPDGAGDFARLLSALPDRQREVLHLVFYHEMTLAQAAAVMAVSIGAARQHYDRAKRAVRRQLTEKATDESRPRPRSAVPGIVL